MVSLPIDFVSLRSETSETGGFISLFREKKVLLCFASVSLRSEIWGHPRSDAVKDRCSTGQMLYSVQVRCSTGKMQERSDEEQDGCRTGQMQYWSDAVKDRCRKGRMQDTLISF